MISGVLAQDVAVADPHLSTDPVDGPRIPQHLTPRAAPGSHHPTPYRMRDVRSDHTLALAVRASPEEPLGELKRLSAAVRAYARRRTDRLVAAYGTGWPTGPLDAGESNRGVVPTGNAVAAPASSAGTELGDVPLRRYAHTQAERLEEGFFRGRYDRSRARLPENVALWRERPDIANPGPDLANFPNSAFTLPAGRAYVEVSPFTYYGSAQGTTAQHNAEFLLRYGVTDDVEFRIFGNGVSWSGGAAPVWGFAPIAFDTKIQLWTEKPGLYLPAAAVEAYLQTQWFGGRAFNGGTQPSITFNFDQSLPLEIDLEYNIGATRVQAADGENVWEESFQWALQRDFFDEDFAVFVHGFYNAMTLPRLPNLRVTSVEYGGLKQNAVGLGFIWTADRRLAIYGQMSGGTTRNTPSTIGMLGFAVAF